MTQGDADREFVEAVLEPLLIYFVEWLGEVHAFMVPEEYGGFGAEALVYRFMFEGDIQRLRALWASRHARERTP